MGSAISTLAGIGMAIGCVFITIIIDEYSADARSALH
jgi:hypothetical protein